MATPKTKRKESTNAKGGTQTESVFILLPFDLKLRLIEMAKREGRSVSSQGARIIGAFFESQKTA